MLLSIDWDFFVPEKPEWDIQHCEDKFYTDTMWEIRAVQTNLLEEMQTNGEEVHFWERIKNNFDLSGAELIVTDSHKFSYDLAKNCNEVVSFDSHCDLYYNKYEDFLKETEVRCDNWLGSLLRDNLIEKASIVLSEHSNEWDAKDTEFETGDIVIINSLASLGYNMLFRKHKVKTIHICRSGGWTPPWLDSKFEKFVKYCGVKPLVYAVPYRSFNEDIIKLARKEYVKADAMRNSITGSNIFSI